MKMVESGSGLNVDRTSRSAARLGGKSVIDDLEVTDGFRQELRPAAATVLIII